MSAGKGTPRISLGSEVPPPGTIIVESDRWISQLVLDTGEQELTDDFAAYSTDGYVIPLGALRGGVRFAYTPAEPAAFAEMQFTFGGDYSYIVTQTPPTFTEYNASLEIYRAVYKTPPANAGTDPVEGLLEFPVPAAGFTSLVLGIMVRETATLPGTIEITRVFTDNYGPVYPNYPVR